MSDNVQDDREAIQPVPDWLRRAWEGARQRGLDHTTIEEIQAEIETYRREKSNTAK